MFHRKQEGASALEFALVLPILVALFYGLITGGIAFNRKLQMNHATREGARFAATLPDAPSTSWADQVATQALEASATELFYADPTVALCVFVQSSDGTLTREGVGSSAYSSIADFVNGMTDGSGTCFADGLGGSRVQVRASRGARLSTVFLSKDLTLVAEAVSVYEEVEEP